MTTGDIPKNCTTCAFQHKCNKGKSMYCALKRFVILNPEVGCSRQMMKSEFESKNSTSLFGLNHFTAEEILAAIEAKEAKNEGS